MIEVMVTECHKKEAGIKGAIFIPARLNNTHSNSIHECFCVLLYAG